MTTHKSKDLEWEVVQICSEFDGKSQECRANEEKELIYLSMVHMVDPPTELLQKYEKISKPVVGIT